MNPNRNEFESEALFRIRTNRLRSLIKRNNDIYQPVYYIHF